MGREMVKVNRKLFRIPLNTKLKTCMLPFLVYDTWSCDTWSDKDQRSMLTVNMRWMCTGCNVLASETLSAW